MDFVIDLDSMCWFRMAGKVFQYRLKNYSQCVGICVYRRLGLFLSLESKRIVNGPALSIFTCIDAPKRCAVPETTAQARLGALWSRLGTLARCPGSILRRLGAQTRCPGMLRSRFGAENRCTGAFWSHLGAQTRFAGALQRALRWLALALLRCAATLHCALRRRSGAHRR